VNRRNLRTQLFLVALFFVISVAPGEETLWLRPNEVSPRWGFAVFAYFALEC
jgi:hypothetical protein